MTHVVIPKDRISELVKKLIGECRLVAPVREDKNLVFKEVKDADEVVLNDEIAYKSPKEFLFPQVEEIMTFNENGELLMGGKSQKTVILGVKPCDLEALKVMTAVFTKGKYVDTYFSGHMKDTVLVGIGCVSEKPGCFCSERGIDRGFSSECDILLTDIGNSYDAKIFSERGKELLQGFGFEEAALEKTDSEGRDGNLEIEADEGTLFNSIDWERISEKCLGCGTCTYICPTCHCFEFKDVVENGKSVRYRHWDSCMYPRFTLHASGHNPRASKRERYRQRILHKYLYVKQNFGYTACTGCGRCIRSCPAGMNIRSVVSGIIEDLKTT